MIPEQLYPALMGVLPSTLTTCDRSGIPNLTNISRVWRVDDRHVAIANHMLNKSKLNLLENRLAYLRMLDPSTFSTWELEAEFVGSQTDGAVFDDMKKHFEIVSMMVESGQPITVRSAEVFRVLSARLCAEEDLKAYSIPDVLEELLVCLDKSWGWSRSAVWRFDDSSDSLKPSTVHGIEQTGENEVISRIALWSCRNGQGLCIRNIRSQFKYARSASLRQPADDSDENGGDEPVALAAGIHQHYIAIPLKDSGGRTIAVIGSQSDDENRFAMFDEPALARVSRHLSELLVKIAVMPADDRRPAIERTLELIQLEASKRNEAAAIPLSARELQVAIQVARGLSNVEIASVLFLSKRTVSTHLERIFQKLNISTRAALAVYVSERGLNEPPG